VAEIERSRELGSSQGESPSIGYSKSRGREKREGNNRWIRIAGRPLDPHVGSCIGASREKAREFGHGNHEVASSEIPRGKVSELTDHRVSGIREPSVQPLNSRSHEFRFPDKSRKGESRERTVGADFPIGK
jgi:hypothetical protein